MLKLLLVNPSDSRIGLNTEKILLVYGEVLCILFIDRDNGRSRKAAIWIDGIYISPRMLILNDNFFSF